MSLGKCVIIYVIAYIVTQTETENTGQLWCVVSPPIKKTMENMEIMILRIILCNNHYYKSFISFSYNYCKTINVSGYFI